MSVLFVDSFDHYTDPGNKYEIVSGNWAVHLNTGVARTGIGCLVGADGIGPGRTNLGMISDILVCEANFQSASGSIMSICNFDADIGFNATCVRVQVNADGSISALRGSVGGLIGSTGMGVFTFSSYNSIAVRVQVATMGRVRIWVNGSLQLDVNNVNTTNLNNPALQYATGFLYLGSGLTTLVDDVYVLDCSTPANPNSVFLGDCRVYASVASANASPIQWTPLSAPNFSQTNEIPPDNDTSYVSSATVSQVDQYVYNATGVPAASSILAVQHVLDAKVDSGSRSIASDVNGIINGNSVALPSSYHMFMAEYDQPPGASRPWAGTDFPANFGPAVTL